MTRSLSRRGQSAYTVLITTALPWSFALGAHAPPPETPQTVPVQIVQPVPIQLPAQPIAVQVSQPPQPLTVKVESAPENGEHSLVQGTWGLVIATFLLAALTFFAMRRQGRDMDRSIKTAQDAAAAAQISAAAADRSASAAKDSVDAAVRERREVLLREVNSAGHRARAIAARIQALIVERQVQYQSLSILSGQGGAPNPQLTARSQIISTRVQEIADAANALTASDVSGKSDSDLLADLMRRDEHLVELDSMKEEVSAGLQGYVEECRIQRLQRTQMMAAQVTRGTPPPRGTLG